MNYALIPYGGFSQIQSHIHCIVVIGVGASWKDAKEDLVADDNGNSETTFLEVLTVPALMHWLLCRPAPIVGKKAY